MNYIEQEIDHSDLFKNTDQFEEDYSNLNICLSHPKDGL